MKMKAILLIGRYSDVTQRMSEYLGKYFIVQLCSDNPGMLRRSLEMALPDIAIVSLAGISRFSAEIISELKEHSTVPCLCLGTNAEYETISQYVKTSQFHPLSSSMEDIDLLLEIRKILQYTPDEQEYSGRKRKNILLVDDNPMQLRALRAMLQRDYDVTMALSGAEALTAIGKRVPDLIFLDYEMPVCDGAMTLKMIRGLEEAKNVPVVFLTAVQDREHIVAVIALKPAGYLLKPVSQDKIVETVKELI